MGYFSKDPLKELKVGVRTNSETSDASQKTTAVVKRSHSGQGRKPLILDQREGSLGTHNLLPSPPFLGQSVAFGEPQFPHL